MGSGPQFQSFFRNASVFSVLVPVNGLMPVLMAWSWHMCRGILWCTWDDRQQGGKMCGHYMYRACIPGEVTSVISANQSLSHNTIGIVYPRRAQISPCT